jgi:hypothetical protein
MSELPLVRIVIARCTYGGQSFGLRFEERERGQWLADWAFGINEKSARKEGYDGSEISGSFGFAPDYPGCSYCRATGIYRCVCSKVACWNGEDRTVTCPWCRTSVQLDGTISSIGTGGDR